VRLGARASEFALGGVPTSCKWRSWRQEEDKFGKRRQVPGCLYDPDGVGMRKEVPLNHQSSEHWLSVPFLRHPLDLARIIVTAYKGPLPLLFVFLSSNLKLHSLEHREREAVGLPKRKTQSSHGVSWSDVSKQ
jgi:hypothetical protein